MRFISDDGCLREYIPTGRIVYEWTNDDCDCYYIKKNSCDYSLWYIADFGTSVEKEKELIFNGTFMQCMMKLNKIIIEYNDSRF